MLILVMKSGKYILGYKTVLQSIRSSKDSTSSSSSSEEARCYKRQRLKAEYQGEQVRLLEVSMRHEVQRRLACLLPSLDLSQQKKPLWLSSSWMIAYKSLLEELTWGRIYRT